MKKLSKKAGLPPGTLVYTGAERRDTVKITLIEYDEHRFSEREITESGACALPHDHPGVVWINVEGVHDSSLLERFGASFGIHPLVLEDILHTDQRPKLEDLGEYLFIVLKMLSPDKRNGDIASEQVSIILRAGTVITFQEGLEGDVFNQIRERIRSEAGKTRKRGADYLAYALIDAVIDGYFVVLEQLGDDIEAIEDELVDNPSPETLRTIYRMKRDMLFLRRALWPVREVVGSLERGDSPLVTETTRLYLRDAYDHSLRLIDTVETYRDTVAGMLEIYLSSVSNRLNSVMKVLTIITTIFMPLTFIAGVYGMNFQFMPELRRRWGYPAVLAAMLVVALLMLLFFRRKRWI